MEFNKSLSLPEIYTRYVNNYGLDKDIITIDMVLKHWELEKALTKQLLNSTPGNRKKVFYDAYNTLYEQLPWLVRSGNENSVNNNHHTDRWLLLLGDVKEKNIYEIGSGNGHLIAFLANQGAFCVATEIAEGRPNKLPVPNLEWHNTDGVNLTEYEPKEHYDFVISDQVIEHLHPDDISIHLKNVRKILKNGGKYLFYTPSYYTGPGDVSLVFGTLEAEGMHLKEYKYFEMFDLLRNAGYSRIDIPQRENLTKLIPAIKIKSFLLFENCLSFLNNIHLRKKIYHRLYKYFDIPDELLIIAEK